MLIKFFSEIIFFLEKFIFQSTLHSRNSIFIEPIFDIHLSIFMLKNGSTKFELFFFNMEMNK